MGPLTSPDAYKLDIFLRISKTNVMELKIILALRKQQSPKNPKFQKSKFSKISKISKILKIDFCRHLRLRGSVARRHVGRRFFGTVYQYFPT